MRSYVSRMPSSIDCVAGLTGDFWHFTLASAQYVFQKYFSSDNLEVKSWGNAYAAANFLFGFAEREADQKKSVFRRLMIFYFLASMNLASSRLISFAILCAKVVKI